MDCQVCMERTPYYAYGECRHDICIHCCCRLRRRMGNNRCTQCRKSLPIVVISEYRQEKLPDEELRKLTMDEMDEEALNRYRKVEEINAYCTDLDAYRAARDLCSIGHPILKQKQGIFSIDVPQRFETLAELQQMIWKLHKKKFCEICLKYRDILIYCQILYSEEKLKQHIERGDSTGPFSAPAFRGHPKCPYCLDRYFDDNHHYSHMESEHFHCKICRANEPRKYTYFNTHEDLQKHYEQHHFVCSEPNCSFLVFETREELMDHYQCQHGGYLQTFQSINGGDSLGMESQMRSGNQQADLKERRRVSNGNYISSGGGRRIQEISQENPEENTRVDDGPYSGVVGRNQESYLGSFEGSRRGDGRNHTRGIYSFRGYRVRR